MCFDDVVRLGVELWRGCKFFFLAEGLKIEFFGISGRESSLVQTFCESCKQLDITHPSIHMTQRFVIQGCPTLSSYEPYYVTVYVQR